ncbi:ARM repeat-containing protein [Aaosphaeria arxii CBS 175.79]|uniref:ARM repeat-containing protein n=1 Tax=Aaosphaeria arxii CBS 175.79 TaxID=1450172 RepID=A0A6A5XUE5_9PLEO|nr:ARM repeat-containing protein [Aaosphaeria arxii CBS 175.79]KAF2016549.1 ARM repeat-containing protein [Aaosphaeria arxii CBS 175.79]
MELLDLQSRRDEEEIHRLSSDIQYGKHSQPTTPPEYSDSFGFPTALSRPNRFSMSSVTGVSTPRGSRSGSQITSPPSGQATQGASHNNNNHLPSKSVPGSRRNSDEEGDDFDNTEFAPMSPVFRNNNRMSMPVTNLDLRGRDDLPDLASVLGHINTAAFLFGDDEKSQNTAPSPDAKSFLQMNTTDDKFPILVRRDTNGNGAEGQNGGWSSYRHRHSQQSLPTNTLRKASQVDEYDVSQVNGNGNVETTPTKPNANNRRSVEFSGFSPYGGNGNKRSSYHASPSNGMPKLQQSYSSNDVPTLKNGDNGSGANGSGFGKTHAEQHLHNHNANMGRIPANAVSNRHSRDLSSGFKDQDSPFRSPQSGLHASAAPFGPTMSAASSMNGSVAGSVGSPGMSQYPTNSPANGPYYGYNVAMLNGAMNGLNLGPQMGAPQMNAPQMGAPPVFNPNGVYPTGPSQYYNPYTTFGPNGRVQDSQARVIQSRRMQNDANRFMNYDLKTMPRHEIYTLCKDQHGCRFLQKKLEERNEEHLDIIFQETAPHVVELMTDPFGNYLCQKLLEYTNDEQRDALVRNAAPSLVQIALNQHGTRALQKMIEFVSTPQQIRMIIEAFADQVVELIQDLNGNHVIQKCLNHLKAEDAQFIFDAVGQHCVTVGTHRHGCCVLQRCIDHASGFQKVQLVRQITNNSFNLVQDPFGNYVVQYILDLNDPSFTNPLCVGFASKVAELSKQKFSSNVIEKCIRCADMETKRILIEELMNPEELEKLMRDSYGNYVIQTALEFAPPELCLLLIDNMRPILPAIRQTPYGRRIQSKVQERESRLQAYTGRNSGHVSPHTISTTQSPERRSTFSSQIAPASGFQNTPMYTAHANSYGSNIASPQPHRLSNPPLPTHIQNSVHNQAYAQYGGGQTANGMNNFF